VQASVGEALEGFAASPFPARSAGEARRRHAHEVLGSLAAGEAPAEAEVDATLGAETGELELKSWPENCPTS
jgi:hypothetical protein